MSTPIISKGSSFNLSVGDVELKSIIVADPTPIVGEAAVVTAEAHDGTKYTTPGTTGDNTLGLELMQTLEEFTEVMTYAYGAPTVVGSVSTWDMTSVSNTTGTITITSPVTDATTTGWQLVEAKALSVTPLLPIGGFSRMTLNVAGDNWKAILDEDA